MAMVPLPSLAAGVGEKEDAGTSAGNEATDVQESMGEAIFKVLGAATPTKN
jgi:hypothetical protein